MKNPRLLVSSLMSFAAGMFTMFLLDRDEPRDPPAPPPVPKLRERPVATESASPRSVARTSRRVTISDAEAREREAARIEQVVGGIVEDALQLTDPSLRAAALQRLRDDLDSSDPGTRRAALDAFSRLNELDFDKTSYRSAILPHLSSADVATRAAAALALYNSGLQEGDAELLRQAARRGLGDRTSSILLWAEKGDLTGESGEIVRDLLASDSVPLRETLRGLWGGAFSPELESDVIAISHDPAHLHDAVYFALSTQRNKSAAAVERLIEVLGHPDTHNTGGRAAWGLRSGVAREQHSMVADAALEIASTRASGYLVDQAWDLLDRYAGRDQLEGLEVLATKPNLAVQRAEQANNLLARAEQSSP